MVVDSDVARRGTQHGVLLSRLPFLFVFSRLLRLRVLLALRVRLRFLLFQDLGGVLGSLNFLLFLESLLTDTVVFVFLEVIDFYELGNCIQDVSMQFPLLLLR